MARYRDALPQLTGRLFLTDGGIETTLIFHEGLDLPDFAAFHLLKTAQGEATLRKYFRTYAEIAKRYGAGLILESATWRASADWGARLGYAPAALAYRLLVTFGIAIFLARKFFVVGVALAIWACATLLLWPLGKALHYVLLHPRLQPTRRRAAMRVSIAFSRSAAVITTLSERVTPMLIGSNARPRA